MITDAPPSPDGRKLPDMTRRKTATVALSTAGLLVLTGGVAYAAWSLTGSGNGSAGAKSVGAPGTPTQAAPAPTSTTISLSWSAAAAPGAGSLGYVVERSVSGTTIWTPACGSTDAAPLPATSCTDTGLTANTSYVYRVTAAFAKWRTTSGQSSVIKTAAAAPVVAPTVTSTSPSSRGAGAVNQTVTVTGTGFVNGAVVGFARPTGTTGPAGIKVNGTTFVSSTQLTVNIDVEVGAAAGPRKVTVTNPDTGEGSCECFTVNAGPTTTTFSPSARAVGSSSTSYTLSGSNFANGAAVTFSGTGVTATVGSGSSSTATTLSGSLTVAATAQPGPRDVIVVNPDGGRAVCSGCFTVNAQPTLLSVDPTQIKQSATVSVTLTGTGFGANAGVVLSGNGLSVSNVTVVSSTRITFTLAAGKNASEGARSITVNNTDGGTVTSTTVTITVVA